jgi:ketosteroid isomerase-like protein
MSSNREIVTDAFRSWANGTGYVASLFADDMTWEITGRSAASRKYANTQQFLDECLHPFGTRFSSSDPFRPVNIRAIYDDEDSGRSVGVARPRLIDDRRRAPTSPSPGTPTSDRRSENDL